MKPTLRFLWACVAAILSGCGEDYAQKGGVEDSAIAPLHETSEPAQEQLTLGVHIDRLQEMLATNQSSAAWSLARELLLQYPNSQELIFLAATACGQAGDYRQAIEVLSGVPDEFGPPGMAANGQAAEWLTALGEFEQAVAKFEKMRRWVGESAGASMIDRKLINVYAMMGNRYQVLGALRRLLRRGDIRQPELAQIRGMFEPTMPEDGSSDKLLAFHAAARARFITLGQNPADALTLLKEHFNHGKDLPVFITLYLRLLADNQEWHEFPIHAKHESLDLESPDYWLAIGLWAFHHEDPEGAIRCFAEAVLRDRTDMRTGRLLAESVAAVGDPAVAKRLFERSRLLHEAFDRCSEVGPTGTDPTRMQRAAETLRELEETHEALIWETLAASISKAPKRDLNTITAEWKQLRESGASEVDPVCGLQYQHYPVPRITISATSKTPDGHFVKNWPGISLRDVAGEVGIDFQFDNGFRETDNWLLHHGIGGGVGVLDFDLNDFPDLYFAQAACQPFTHSSESSNALLMNDQGRSWLDVTSISHTQDFGFSLGIGIGDVNQDGMPDIVVANIGNNRLLLNQGDGTFQDASEIASYQSAMFTTSVGIADMNGDALPDIFDSNYTDDPELLTKTCPLEDGTPATCSPKEYRPAHNELHIANPDGSFTRHEMLPSSKPYKRASFGIVIADIDGHPGNECFVANDMTPNTLWSVSPSDTQDVSGTRFVDHAYLKGVAFGPYGQPSACMGVAFGDIDRNGRMDLFVTNFFNELSDLFLQSSSGMFRNAVTGFGLQKDSFETLGFGTQLADLDNDGWLDLVGLNGHIHDHTHRGIPYAMPPFLYRGTPGRFVPVKFEDGSFWEAPAVGRSLARLDWNRDGRMDIVTSHIDRPSALLQNETQTDGGWLMIRFIGTDSERDAIGTTVRVSSNAGTVVHSIAAGDGYMCSNEDIVHFGLGKDVEEVSVQVVWPSGFSQQFDRLSASCRWLIVEGRDSAVASK